MKIWKGKPENWMRDQVLNDVTLSTGWPERWISTLCFPSYFPRIKTEYTVLPFWLWCSWQGQMAVQWSETQYGWEFFIFSTLNLIFHLHGWPGYCLCPTSNVLGLKTRDKHCLDAPHNGNGEALTTIGFQSQGKKMLVHRFCLLLYIILYLLPTADNDILAFPVWLVEVKSSKNTFFILLMSAMVFLSWKAQDLFPLSLLF